MSATVGVELSPPVSEIIRRVVACANPDKIVLFGSHARGTARPDSDVDLLVIMPVSGSRRRQAVAIEKSLIGVDLPVDVLLVTPEEERRYRTVPGTIIRPALDEGMVVYERRS